MWIAGSSGSGAGVIGCGGKSGRGGGTALSEGGGGGGRWARVVPATGSCSVADVVADEVVKREGSPFGPVRADVDPVTARASARPSGVLSCRKRNVTPMRSSERPRIENRQSRWNHLSRCFGAFVLVRSGNPT